MDRGVGEDGWHDIFEQVLCVRRCDLGVCVVGLVDGDIDQSVDGVWVRGRTIGCTER